MIKEKEEKLLERDYKKERAMRSELDARGTKIYDENGKLVFDGGKDKKKPILVGVDLIGRNWLILVKLNRLGFSSEEALKIAKAMEKGVVVGGSNLTLEQARKYGKKVLDMI